MINKKRIEDKERILRYLIRKESIQNTYKIARELGIGREEVLDLLHELGKEGKVKLRNGSVRAVTYELSKEEEIKTKNEVEELKERVDKLEKILKFTFRQLGGAIQMGNQKITKLKSKEDEDNPKNEE